jgi:hypothetical protein
VTRGRVAAFGVLLLAAMLAGAFAVAIAHGPTAQRVQLGAPVSVVAALSPAEPRFGDLVTARIRVFVDPARVNPASVRVRTSYAPYETAARVRSVRRAGGVVHVEVTEQLRCLTLECVPLEPRRSFQFEPVQVSWERGHELRRLVVPWTPLRVHGRVGANDVASPALRVGRPEAADLGYAIPPRVAGFALLAVAAGLASLGAGLLLRLALAGLRRRQGKTALQRILDELTSADPGRRRRALEELARELAPRDLSLATESRVLAWAPRPPADGAVDDLARRVLDGQP